MTTNKGGKYNSTYLLSNACLFKSREVVKLVKAKIKL